MRRALRALAALALLGGAAAGAPSDDDDYVLLNVQLGRLALTDNIQGYHTGKTLCLVLSDAAKAFDFPLQIDAKTGRATGWFVKEANGFALDRTAGTVTVAGKSAPLAPRAIRDTKEGWCADAAMLAGWWALKFAPDFNNSLITVTSEAKLPIEAAMERRARQAKLYRPPEPDAANLPHAKLPYRLWRAPAIDIVASADTLDDSQRGRRADLRYEAYATGEIARVSTESRLASDGHGVPATLRVRGYRKDADARLLGPLHATEVSAGDVHGYASPLVNQAGSGRGAFVTNQPLDRPQTFDRTDFRGELPAGWDAELYRNGQLIAFANNRADGRYEFLDVPLQFGPNRFEVVLYGPQGQIRRQSRDLSVGQASIPPKATYYWAGALQDDRDLITLKSLPTLGRGHPLRASAVIERGIDRRTGVSLQLHSLEAGDEQLTYVEGNVRRSIGPAVVEAGAAAATKGGRAVRIALVANFGEDNYVTAESTRARNFQSDRIERGLASRHEATVEHYFHTARGVVPVALAVRYDDWRDRDDEVSIAGRVSTSLAGVYVTNEIRWLRSKGTGPDPPDRVEGSMLANTRIGGLRLRGEARFRLRPDARFDTATLVGEWAAGPAAEWRGELEYERPLHRMRFGLGYARRFERFALGLNAEAATDGSVAAGLNLAVSLGRDAEGRLARLSPDKLAATGQAAARVFADDNGDGRWEPGEPLVPGVGLTVGTSQAPRATDSKGRAMIDGLRAFQPQLVGIDSATIPDPYLQPGVAGIVVVPRPGLAAPVDLPLVRAGEVDGTLLLARGGATPQPFGGVDLELVDRLGHVARTARSEYDGFFLFEGVPLGTYAVRLAVSGGLRAPPAAVEVGGRRPVAHAGKLIVTAPAVAAGASALAPDG